MRILGTLFLTLAGPAFAGESSHAEDSIHATCVGIRKIYRDHVDYGASVYYSEPEYLRSLQIYTQNPRFRQTKWFGDHRVLKDRALLQCVKTARAFSCRPGEPRTIHGRGSVTATDYPWVMIGPRGVIKSYSDGPFAWNSSALEYCMEDLVDLVFERL